MKNSLMDLNNYLFEAIERILDDDLSDEGLDVEIKRAEAVSKVGRIVIDNANTQLRAMEHVAANFGVDNNYPRAIGGIIGRDTNVFEK